MLEFFTECFYEDIMIQSELQKYFLAAIGVRLLLIINLSPAAGGETDESSISQEERLTLLEQLWDSLTADPAERE